MTEFGDTEPEDTWNADDTIAEQLDNLHHRIALLDHQHTDEHIGVGRQLRAISDRLDAVRASRMLQGRDRVRADELEADILFVRHRIEA